MNWFRENRFLGAFLILASASALSGVWFLWGAKSDWDAAATRFNETATELNRLERLTPYPTSENVREMKRHVDDYANTLARLKEELKTHLFPLQPLAPNEFQTHLRVAAAAVTEKARANKVKLPEKFYLGFDEFVSSLPNALAAPLLGQELAQIEWLLDALIEARVDALISFRRTPLREEQGIALTPSIPAGRKLGATVVDNPKIIERNLVEATFTSTPAAARRVLNQIAGTSEHFFIVRLLRVRNERDKGPPREVVANTPDVVATPPPMGAGTLVANPALPAAINFIVGNEHIEVATKIEIVRFMF